MVVAVQFMVAVVVVHGVAVEEARMEEQEEVVAVAAVEEARMEEVAAGMEDNSLLSLIKPLSEIIIY
jgi:hypothetical protein